MRTRLVSVVGSGKNLPKVQIETAEALGEALARAGIGVVCGGLRGVMEAVARGFVKGRGKQAMPPVIGLLPSYDAESANGYLDIAIPTGLGHSRNVLVAAAGEVMVCIGGSTGALSEVALARKIKRPVITFPATGGTAKLVSQALPAVETVASVKEALARIQELLG
jgi:uncharacterized protein (TIGR00725 family)